MNRKEILDSIMGEDLISIPQLQSKFKIGYLDAKCIVDGLVKRGEFVYSHGVFYCRTDKFRNETSTPFTGSRTPEKTEAKSGEGTDEVKDPPSPSALREFFEAYRDKHDKNDEEDEDDLRACGIENLFDDDDDEDDDDELRIRATRLCIRKNSASVSLLQRSFPIGYVKACKIIDWMEEKGYISAANGPFPREILITEAELDNIIRLGLFYYGRDDDDDEDEDPFEALENFQAKHMKLLRENEKKPKPSANPFVVAIPGHPSWDSEFEFIRTVRQQKVQIIKSDITMGVKGAIKRTESLCNEAKSSGDKKLAEVYERIVYELNNTSAYQYKKLKKMYCE